MSAKNDFLLQVEEIVRIYANSKYLDRNVHWVLFILAEYSYNKPPIGFVMIAQNLIQCHMFKTMYESLISTFALTAILPVCMKYVSFRSSF